MEFDTYIKNAINAIKSRNLSLAQEYIHLAMLENDASPIPHNLLGIISEISRDLCLAGKHYRASNSLDFTYSPACHNLERITNFNYRFDFNAIDFGDTKDELKENPYILQYDRNNVGHIIKKF
jgi:hypothetical protein